MNNEKKDKQKDTGDAKGKASLDQNGKGSAPKYGQAGDEPNESGKEMDKTTKKKK